MSNSGHQEKVHVYLWEDNPLASSFVMGILARDSLLRPFHLKDVKKNGSAGHVTSVFLLDNRELQLPLSECLRRLRTDHPDAKFLVMDQEESKENVMQMLMLGINGFMTYSRVPQFLTSAIHAVATGELWVSREMLMEYVQRTAVMSRNPGNGSEALTFRETQIIELVKRRLSNREIAEILSIRESTVKFHLSNIFSKLRVSNRHALVEKGRRGTDRSQVFPDLAYSRG